MDYLNMYILLEPKPYFLNRCYMVKIDPWAPKQQPQRGQVLERDSPASCEELQLHPPIRNGQTYKLPKRFH